MITYLSIYVSYAGLKSSNISFRTTFMTKGWIDELLSKSTRVTVLLMPPAFAEVVLEAASENGMIDSVYVWLVTTPITQSLVCCNL